MNNIKKDKGITLLVLTITIIITIILAAITITEGTKLLKNLSAENSLTNMITIKAKSKVYAEEVNSKIWDLENDEKIQKRVEIFENEYEMMTYTIDNNLIESELSDEVKEGEYECYSITDNTLNKMGISDIDDYKNYIVVYNSNDYTKLDMIYLSGVLYNGQTYYTLSKLQTEMGE